MYRILVPLTCQVTAQYTELCATYKAAIVGSASDYVQAAGTALRPFTLSAGKPTECSGGSFSAGRHSREHAGNS